jgi:hypothetical protein
MPMGVPFLVVVIKSFIKISNTTSTFSPTLISHSFSPRFCAFSSFIFSRVFAAPLRSAYFEVMITLFPLRYTEHTSITFKEDKGRKNTMKQRTRGKNCRSICSSEFVTTAEAKDKKEREKVQSFVSFY